MMTRGFYYFSEKKNVLQSLASTTCEAVLERYLNNDFYRDLKKNL